MSTSFRLSFAVAVPMSLAAIGCGGTSDSGDDKPGFAPAEGTWESGTYTVIDDGCGAYEDTQTDEGDEYTVTHDGDGYFELSVDAGDVKVKWDCALDGKTFDCPEEMIGLSDMSSEGVDAVLTMSGAMAGTFSSEEAGQLDITIGATCTGADCSMLESLAEMDLPCSTTVTEPITHVK